MNFEEFLLDALVLVAALLGAALPLFVPWRDRQLHAALALSTGVFLGAVFLHMLPSVAALSVVGAHGSQGSAAGLHLHGGVDGVARSFMPWGWVLVGVLAIQLVEALVLRTHDHDDLHQHRSVAWATFLGLVVHSFVSGLGLSALDTVQPLTVALTVGFLVHKASEGFSLVTVLRLADLRRSRVVALAVGFALVTPAGMLVGRVSAQAMSSTGVVILAALAAGTFLYVCIAELLMEVFHHPHDNLLKLGLLGAGIALAALVEGGGA